MSALLGPRFGTIATISTCIWLSYKTLPATSDMDLVRSLTHWLTSIVATGAMAAISFALGSLSTLLRNVLRLGRQAMKREADIEAFQTKLKRAHNADQILSYLVGYCRDELKRRVIFLALDESASSSESPENVNIAARLKVAGYARVVVNRRAYVPRAIQSYKSSGFEPFTLETPSGVIGLLGLDTSNGKVLSSLDRRYLKLLLVSTAYALERITLIERLNALDESQLEFKTRNATLLNLIANISNTTHNLDDQTHSLKQLLDREPSRPYETAMNFIRRNISALRNSIALLRDVAS
jgi:K+-sensing histidine kinase KdpD